MKSFLHPANALLFDVEGFYKHSALKFSPRFQPVWSASDIVKTAIPSSSDVLMTSFNVAEFCPFAEKTEVAQLFQDKSDTVEHTTAVTNISEWVRFRYFHPNGNQYLTPSYRVTDDECILNKTIEIRYWNSDKILGGNQYPDITYNDGAYKNCMRICASIDNDGTQENRNFSTDGLGASSVCRAEIQPIFRLTVGPHPQWLHRKLQYAFMHQHIEIRRHGQTDWLSLVPFGQNPYEQTRNISEKYDAFLGEGRLIADEFGVVTC